MKAHFSFSESNEIVYCKRCGQIAGEPTKCTHGYESHDFRRTSEPLVCRRCGATVGTASLCTHGYESHDFRSVLE
jgi:ribosomal protein S27E